MATKVLGTYRCPEKPWGERSNTSPTVQSSLYIPIFSLHVESTTERLVGCRCVETAIAASQLISQLIDIAQDRIELPSRTSGTSATELIRRPINDAADKLDDERLQVPRNSIRNYSTAYNLDTFLS
jgi:hypothetical protein